jgi:hypothetical protein
MQGRGMKVIKIIGIIFCIFIFKVLRKKDQEEKATRDLFLTISYLGKQ